MATDKMKKSNGKIKDVLLLGVLGLVLCVAIWLVFTDGETVFSTARQYSEAESKLVALLEEMDGVGKAEVMVCETDEGILGAVIVCDGAKDLQVNMQIREAVATALGTSQSNVKIYLKK